MGNQDTKKKIDVKKLNPAELQTYLMVTQAKLTQSRNKKVEMIKKKRREIVQTLEDGNLDIAKAKMESVLRDEDYITVFDILGPLCEILKEKVTYLLYSDKCPEDLRATVDTIIYASNRLELDELHRVRLMIAYRYGDIYISKANSNTDQLVNVNVLEKLKVKPAADQYLTARLKQLCKDEKINFEFPQDYVAPIMTSFEPINNNPHQNNFNQMIQQQNQFVQGSQGNFNHSQQNNFQNYQPQQQNFNNQTFQGDQSQFNSYNNQNVNKQNNFNNNLSQNSFYPNMNSNSHLDQSHQQNMPHLNQGQNLPPYNNTQNFNPYNESSFQQHHNINQPLNTNSNSNFNPYTQPMNSSGGFNPNNSGFPSKDSVIVSNNNFNQHSTPQDNRHTDVNSSQGFRGTSHEPLTTINEIGSSYVSSSNSSIVPQQSDTNVVYTANTDFRQEGQSADIRNNESRYSNSASNFKLINSNMPNIETNTDIRNSFNPYQSDFNNNNEFKGNQPIAKKESIHNKVFTNENNYGTPNPDHEDVNQFPSINQYTGHQLHQSVTDDTFPTQMNFPKTGEKDEFPSTKDNSFPKTPGNNDH